LTRQESSIFNAEALLSGKIATLDRSYCARGHFSVTIVSDSHSMWIDPE